MVSKFIGTGPRNGPVSRFRTELHAELRVGCTALWGPPRALPIRPRPPFPPTLAGAPSPAPSLPSPPLPLPAPSPPSPAHLRQRPPHSRWRPLAGAPLPAYPRRRPPCPCRRAPSLAHPRRYPRWCPCRHSCWYRRGCAGEGGRRREQGERR